MCDSYPFYFFFLALRFGADTFRQRLDDLRSLGAESMPISDCWRILSVAQGESERESMHPRFEPLSPPLSLPFLFPLFPVAGLSCDLPEEGD